MAEIRPFRGVRYNPERVTTDLSSVISAPYDVVSPEAQQAGYERNALNVMRLELGLTEPDDTPSNNRYTRASETYRDWLTQRALVTEDQPSFYVCDETFSINGRTVTRRGFFAAVRLADWEEGIVLPHEYTMPKPKQDRLSLLHACHAQFSTLFALYDDAAGAVGTILDRATRGAPLYAFSVGEEIAAAARTHHLWRVSAEADRAVLQGAIRDRRLFIADGHHRYETALTYRDQIRHQRDVHRDAPTEFVLMLLVEANDPGLVVLPTHRLLRGISDVAPASWLDRITPWFEIEIVPWSADPGALLAPLVERGRSRMAFLVAGLAPNQAQILTLRDSVDLDRVLSDVAPVLRRVDTVVLQRLILEPAFGIGTHEVEAGERVTYTRDPSEAIHAVRSGQAQVACFLNATPVAQIRDVASDGQRMPQKSTYFYPKPVTGTVFFDHDRAW